MKQAAIVVALALQLAVLSCGNSVPYNTIATSTTGNWEAKLLGGTGQAAELNFVVGIQLTNNFGTVEPIVASGLGFFNSTQCFQPTTVNGATSVDVNGNAEFTASSSDVVTGTLSLTITSIQPQGNTLVLTASPPAGGLSGTSSGTTSTVGTLSNGVAWGTWQLTGGAGDSSCVGSGTFLMCQAGVTCTIP